MIEETTPRNGRDDDDDNDDDDDDASVATKRVAFAGHKACVLRVI